MARRNVGTYAKSLVAGAIAAVSTAVPLVDDGVTLSEGLLIAGAFLVAQQGVFWTPNKDDTGTHQRESVQPPNA